MGEQTKNSRFLGIGFIPFILGLFIGGFLYTILVGRSPGFGGGSIIGILSVFIFGIPIRMLIDKFKSG